MRPNAFSNPGKFLRGNIHTHSNLSDGALSAEEVCRRYKNNGYDFLSLTEHFLGQYDYPIADTKPFRDESFMTIIVAGGSVKELWLTNEQWGWWAAKMLGTSQPTLRKLFENGGAPVYSWVKNKGTCDREVVKRDLDKRGINLTNDKMTYMGNPHDKMVDLLFVTAQATLPGAITKEGASIF